MNDGDEPGRGSPSIAYPGRHPLPPISLPLHEALGLVLLFQAAPPELVQNLRHDDVLYAFSAAYGYLHLREAIAKLYDDPPTLALIAAERAQLDQYQQQYVS